MVDSDGEEHFLLVSPDELDLDALERQAKLHRRKVLRWKRGKAMREYPYCMREAVIKRLGFYAEGGKLCCLWPATLSIDMDEVSDGS